jgi:hypothetical protein
MAEALSLMLSKKETIFFSRNSLIDDRVRQDENRIRSILFFQQKLPSVL